MLVSLDTILVEASEVHSDVCGALVRSRIVEIAATASAPTLAAWLMALRGNAPEVEGMALPGALSKVWVVFGIPRVLLRLRGVADMAAAASRIHGAERQSRLKELVSTVASLFGAEAITAAEKERRVRATRRFMLHCLSSGVMDEVAGSVPLVVAFTERLIKRLQASSTARPSTPARHESALDAAAAACPSSVLSDAPASPLPSLTSPIQPAAPRPHRCPAPHR